MIPQRFNIRRICGVTIEIDRSSFVLFFLLTAFFATHLSGRSFRLEWLQDWVFGLVASSFFFLSLFLHELGHSLVALRSGIPVRSMKFFIFGGLTELEKKPQSAAQELGIALAGPAMSAAIGGLLLMTSELAPPAWERLILAAHWLGRINVLLAIFNLAPAFPLDGGRALRAIFWKVSGDYERGTQQARICARLVAYGLMLIGGACALSYSVPLGSLLVLIGWRMKDMLAGHHREPPEDSSAMQPVM